MLKNLWKIIIWSWIKWAEVPLLIEEVVDSSVGAACGPHNVIIAKYPSVIPNSHVVSSKMLNSGGDGLNFSAESYSEFGRRYSQVILGLLK